MPRGGFGCAGLFHQDMVVKHLHPLRAHQICGHGRGGAVAQDRFKFWNASPIAVIIKKPPRFAGFQILCRIGARRVHVARNARPQRLHMIGKQAFHQDHAIALKGVDIALGEKGMGHG